VRRLESRKLTCTRPEGTNAKLRARRARAGRGKGAKGTEQQRPRRVKGRKRQLRNRVIPFPPVEELPLPDGAGTQATSVAVVGLGYVGLPTALALYRRWPLIIGLDVSRDRLDAIRDGEADVSDADRRLLADALTDPGFQLASDSAALATTDVTIICVPTPVDSEHSPELSALRSACETVVAHAHPGQIIILTSTSFVGTTRQLLIEPLERRGMRVGTDVHVAFSPERIDPGNPDHLQRETPRVVGGATPECARRAARVIADLTDSVFLVSSPEVAELTKLYENIFRAVTLALANEFADVCGLLALDPIEVTLAAGTKPYGFLGAFPGPGVGGHCIPCDPHYLLWQLRERGRHAPLIEQAMASIEARPGRVVERAVELLAGEGLPVAGARVIVLAVSYKAGVRDLRESPAIPIIAELTRRGAQVAYHDPLIPQVRMPDGRLMHSVVLPRGGDWDLVLVHGIQGPADLGQCQRVRKGQVAALPAGLKLLLKLEERLTLTQIAETVCQEFHTAIQQGCIIVVDIAQRSESQAYHVGPITFEVFYGACE